MAFEEAPLFNSIKLSVIVVLVVALVTVVPLTVRLPVISTFLVTVRSCPIVTSLGRPIVNVLLEAVVLISFAVPLITNT